MSGLAKREEKTAYKLLLPAFIILILVAIYPLGQVFYMSFTDRRFACFEEANFIGLDNYRRLLSMTIKELSPVIDMETGQQKINPATNELVFERPLDVLPRELRRYRELKQFNLFGRRYVIGATGAVFIVAISDTLVFTIISVFLELLLGLAIAMVINSKFQGRGMVRVTMLIPWAVITVVSARMWEWMLASNRTGLFNTVLDKFGIGDGHIAFLAVADLQMPALIMMDVWKTTPFIVLLLLAGLQTIPSKLYEAADIDGASKIRQFFSITLPLLKPAMAVALIFRTLDALRVFDIFHVLLGSSRFSMASYNFFQLVGNRAMGLSSAIGVIIFILILAFAVFYIKILGVDSK